MYRRAYLVLFAILVTGACGAESVTFDKSKLPSTPVNCTLPPPPVWQLEPAVIDPGVKKCTLKCDGNKDVNMTCPTEPALDFDERLLAILKEKSKGHSALGAEIKFQNKFTSNSSMPIEVTLEDAKISLNGNPYDFARQINRISVKQMVNLELFTTLLIEKSGADAMIMGSGPRWSIAFKAQCQTNTEVTWEINSNSLAIRLLLQPPPECK